MRKTWDNMSIIFNNGFSISNHKGTTTKVGHTTKLTGSNNKTCSFAHFIKGLCYKCDELLTKRYKCKMLFLIEGVGEEDTESEDE